MCFPFTLTSYIKREESRECQPERERRREEKKGKRRKNIRDEPTSLTQERRQHARAIRILETRKERGGGVAPRRNNRITESATKESREAKMKAKKARW